MKNLMEKRDNIFNEAKELIEGAKVEERELTEDELNDYNTKLEIVEQLNNQISAEKRSIEIEKNMVNVPLNEEPETREDKDEKNEFRSFLKLEKRDVAFQEGVSAPKFFVNELIKSLEERVFIRSLARGFRLTRQEGITIPKRTAKAGNATWGNSPSADTDYDTGSITLLPQPLNKIVKLDKQLVKVSSLPIEREVQDEMVDAMGRTLEEAYLTGDGANNTPFGIFDTTAVPTSQDVEEGTGIEAKAFIAAKNKLPSGYNPVWVIHPDVLTEIEDLKDGNGRYIFTQSFRQGEPDLILGIPVYKSEFAPNDISAGSYIAALADFGKGYVYSDVENIELQVLKEKYSDTNQIGYKGYFLTTGNVADEKAFIRIKVGA